MSLCDHCGEREAVIHLTQVVNDSVTTVHLCETCAAERGVDTAAHIAKYPLGDFLATLGEGTGETAAAGDVCPGCGATLDHFRRTGRLGCARCYATFAPALRELLRRLHGSTRHKGERYAGAGAEGGPGVPAGTLTDLRERLRRAVETEDVEEAARLRDAIRGLE